MAHLQFAFVFAVLVPSFAIALDDIPIGQAIKNHASGFGAQEDGVNWAELEVQGRAFVKFKRGRLGKTERAAYLENCESESGRTNVFCDVALGKPLPVDPEEIEEENALDDDIEPVVRDKAPLDIEKSLHAINHADLGAIEKISERRLRKLFKYYQKGEALKPLFAEISKNGSCSIPRLITQVGLKAEGFFPIPEYREIAKSVYRRSEQCFGSKDSNTWDKHIELAHYRLSMLLLWENRYKDADPILTKLTDKKSGEFNSRSLFWRAISAEEQGNKLAAAALKGRLMREFPVSYHGLLLSKHPSRNVASRLDAPEPVIKLRTQKKPEINARVRAIEVLQKLGAHDLALKVLAPLEAKLTFTEPEFRLYLATLSRRSGDMIGKFKILSSLFREDTSMIARTTMELFYPLSRFEVLKKHGGIVDPYLVAALIRQESGFNESARSKAGALGLMQLMPATARRMERVNRSQLLDAKTNVRLGVRYFSSLLKRFEGDVELALAGYNAGPERVEEWVKRYPTDNRILFLDLIPFSETRNYVVLIVRNYLWYSTIYKERVLAGEMGGSGDSSVPHSYQSPRIVSLKKN